MATPHSILHGVVLASLFVMAAPSVLKGDDDSRARARTIFDGAVETHRDIGMGRVVLLEAEGFKAVDGIFWDSESGDLSTSKTIHREWRHSFLADYETGAILTETARVADIVGGVQQPLPSSVALAYRSCSDCPPGGHIPQSSRRNPQADLERGTLREDALLIDPFRFTNRMYGENLAEHLAGWSDDYVDMPEMLVTVDQAADGSASTVTFEDSFTHVTFKYSFDQSEGKTRLIGFERSGLIVGTPPPKCEVKISWGTFTTEDGTTIEFPAEVVQFSGETPQQTREVRRLTVTRVHRTSPGREWFEDNVAARTAGVTFDSVRRNLEFDSKPQ